VDIKPVDQSVKLLLESSFYRVPRFQRPYSWDRDNVSDFWTDAVASEDKDYFIGSFVVFKNAPADDTLLVVDGQQRLTTITLLLAAVRNAFDQNGDEELALGVQQLIERKDINNHKQFVLQTESSYPFLHEYIQKHGKPEVPEELGVEEEDLNAAYEFLTGQVHKRLKTITDDPTLAEDKKAVNKRKALIDIRDKLMRLQLIKVELTSEDDAYVIFETLNTRGKDLRVADLVKNHLTRLIKPKNKNVDTAKDKWEKILAHFEESEEVDVDINRFLHHAWISRKPYVPEKKLFKEVRKLVKQNNAVEFLDDLVSDGKLYRQIVDPAGHKKWSKDERPCHRSLRAINLFRVVQPVPMLLSIMRAYSEERLTLKQVRKLLRTMENFHFQFSAITKQRTGGGTGQMFALAARDLQAATNKNKADQVLKTFEGKLRERLPTQAEFDAQFEAISHTEQSSKQRGLVRYLLGRIREYEEDDTTTDYEAMTIEHLSSQSPDGAQSLKRIGEIGNLILVTGDLNGKLKNKGFDKKITILKQHHYALEAKLKNATKWNDQDIAVRTRFLAKLCYEKVFRV
jgi:uncharacterized protein with ParB-like and HNH nuclease domain